MADYPKDRDENLRLRQKLRNWASGNPAGQIELIERCRDDLLFWINIFCWLDEPRAKREESTDLPFITWEHQDPMLLDFEDAVYNGTDVGVEKSRGEGVSWGAIAVYLHQILFRKKRVGFGMVSKTEKAADDPDDPNSLGYKLDFLVKRLPIWMARWELDNEAFACDHQAVIRRLRSSHSWTNARTGSNITAYATTGDLSRGGRKTSFLLDEWASFPIGDDERVMSSLVEVTDSVIGVSTPQGPRGAYYKAMKEPSANMKKIRIHWTMNETRNRGLYEVKNGIPVAVDPENNPLPAGYAEEFVKNIKPMLQDRGFDITKGVRSPWYDGRCLRLRMTPQFISQEYDIDYTGATSLFFSLTMLDRLQKETARPPLLTGEVDFNRDNIKPRWRANDSGDGHMLLWFELTFEDAPPRGIEYIVGADVATGLGGANGSNSTLSVIEKDTGVKVAEFAHANMPPELFAEQAVAVCMWFNNAELIWEDQGPGKQFRSHIVSHIKYKHLFTRTKTDYGTLQEETKLGFGVTKENKYQLLSTYSDSLQMGYFVNPSHLALEECKGYEIMPNRTIEHVASVENDPSGAKENHGDRATADALACWVQRQHVVAFASEGEENTRGGVPENSPLGRRKKAKEKNRQKNSGYWLDQWKQRRGNVRRRKLRPV